MGRYGGEHGNIGGHLETFAREYFNRCYGGGSDRDTKLMRGFMERLQECGRILEKLESYDVGPAEGMYLDVDSLVESVLQEHPAARET